MASPRGSRPCCIRAALSATSTRAGFWKRRRNALHRLQFLDLHAGLEDTLIPLAYSLKDWPPGDLTCHWPSHALKPRSQSYLEDSLWLHMPSLPVRTAGGAPAPPGADDVDMQPVEGGSPGVMEGAWGSLLPAGESLEPGRQAQRSAQVSRQPPGLRSERDKGHRLSLSKRKLDLLLSEPEKRKRKRQHAT